MICCCIGWLAVIVYTGTVRVLGCTVSHNKFKKKKKTFSREIRSDRGQILLLPGQIRNTLSPNYKLYFCNQPTNKPI